MGLAVVGKLMHRRQVLRSLASIDIVFDVWKSVLCSGKQWIPFLTLITQPGTSLGPLT